MAGMMTIKELINCIVGSLIGLSMVALMVAVYDTTVEIKTRLVQLEKRLEMIEVIALRKELTKENS